VVGSAPVDANRRRAAADAPAHYLVAGVGLGVARLDRDPGVDGEEAAPADRPGGVHLDDRLAGGRWIGCLPGWTALELPEVRPRAFQQATAGQRDQHDERYEQLHPPNSFLIASSTSAASFSFTTRRGVTYRCSACIVS